LGDIGDDDGVLGLDLPDQLRERGLGDVVPVVPGQLECSAVPRLLVPLVPHR